MSQDWINFVKRYAHEHNLNYGEALHEAAPHYRNLASRSKRAPSRSSSKRSSMRAPKRNRKLSVHDYYHAGKIIGGLVEPKSKAPKGALAALLSGLDARVKIE